MCKEHVSSLCAKIPCAQLNQILLFVDYNRMNERFTKTLLQRTNLRSHDLL